MSCLCKIMMAIYVQIAPIVEHKRFKTSLFFIIALLVMSETFSQGGVGINNTGAVPDTSAILDVSSSNQGLLIPRVALDSTNDATTISGPATSLLVYNTGGSLTPDGYYFNQGTPAAPNWIRLATGTGLSAIQSYTSNATSNKPAGLTHIVVEVWGAGGGGAGASGGGGGGGGYAMKLIAASVLGATETVTVGTGGNGGAAAASPVGDGTAGVTSSFGTHVSATGGAGGISSTNVAGVGGNGSGGDINITGATGQAGGNGSNSIGTPSFEGGDGGDSPRGGGGGGGGHHNTATVGSSPGGGGGGGGVNAVSTSFAGAAGANGMIIVHEYTNQ